MEFLAAGLCASAFVDTAKRWDTHNSSLGQHENYEVLFDGLIMLAESLQAHNMLDDTLVLVLSEMTRTPKYNEDGGKDHWPHTSAMAFGAGVKGGYTFGATSDLLESLPMDFATGEASDAGEVLDHDQFAASMLALADIDPVPWFGDIGTLTAWKA